MRSPKMAGQCKPAPLRNESTWLANISHEMRTPLNAIIGFSELMILNSASLDHRHAAYARDIHRSGHQLLQVIRDMLDLASLETGSRTLTDEPLKLLDLLEDCTRKLSATMESRRTRVAITQIGMPVIVLGDRAALQEVFSKLVSNAVNFGPANESVDVALSTSRNGGTIVAVTDRGPGISQSAARQLLSPLDFGDATVAREYGGTGLGLAIAKTIVELHEGKLSIHSSLGQGTTMVVELPRARIVYPPSGADSLPSLQGRARSSGHQT
ncbi:sensor histidine kinase [Dongia deserti]|uniref:sensor histidine kinase n=1 Tax=Dongia deserti TaxID=2268030 RepID=UPI000E64F7B0|nr:HAMP domain-containing sensor histidine kinase [Dongia deserti]